MYNRYDMSREIGVLSNTFENMTIDWVKTEVVNKAEQGDITSLYTLERIVRYSDQAEVVEYAKSQLARIEAALYPTGVPAPAEEEEEEGTN